MKVLQKFISLIYFRVYLEVNVCKNLTNFSRWSVRTAEEFLQVWKLKLAEALVLDFGKEVISDIGGIADGV